MWVLNKADGVQRELLDTVKARKLAYYGHTVRKQGSCVEKEIMQGTMLGACRRGRPRTAWMDNVKTWTGLSVEESIRMTEDRHKWRKYVHGVADPRIEDGKGKRTEQNSLWINKGRGQWKAFYSWTHCSKFPRVLCSGVGDTKGLPYSTRSSAAADGPRDALC